MATKTAGGKLRPVTDARNAGARKKHDARPTEARSTPAMAPVDPDDVPPMTPNEAAAIAVISRLLRQHPGLYDAAGRQGAVIAVQVPAAEWVHPVADAWRRHVLGTFDFPNNGDRDELQTAYPEEWEMMACHPGIGERVEFRREGIGAKAPGRRDGNECFRTALLLGRSVLGFSPAPERHLPADLVRVADLRVSIPPLDGAALGEVAELLTGSVPTVTVPDDVARMAGLGELWLAARPDGDPDAYLRRVLALVGDSPAATPSLDDVHGMDEAVAFLKRLGTTLDACRRGDLPLSALPSGIVLAGDPGTGKTKLAAIAAAALRVPLVTGSPGEWQAAGHLGDMLAAMRATFAEARRLAPCILLVDEVDGYGDRSRARSDRNYQVQSINAFLEELDGAHARDGVFVIGTCNDPTRLDPAILRSGRLERVIHVPRPDTAALSRILRQHLGSDLAAADLGRAAALGIGGTGADAMRWVRDARQRALAGGRPVAMADLLAEIGGAVGQADGEVHFRVAVHEAGHAAMAAIEAPGSLAGVSMRATFSGAGLAVMSGAVMPTREGLTSMLRRLLGGRAAEEVVLGEPSAGAGGSARSDLAQATVLAAALVFSLGLSGGDGDLVWHGCPDPAGVAEMLAARPDLEVRVEAIVAEAYAATLGTLRLHEAGLRRVADALAERLALGPEEVAALLADGDG